ncbi:MAG: histidine--tRNA ligase, partial [Nitrospirota bacterium]|nr:histidine--tRNA ligase [Nitrospirota bacterium]
MSFQAVKGVKDVLPSDIETWRRLEETAREVFRVFGFREVRVPIFEYTEVFTRSIGDTTDIVEKEMYTFEDGSGRRITLRPEGTAPVVRAFVEHSLYAQSPVNKLWYMGPMFRRERPQAGRYRQFHQIGAELFGAENPASDVDMLVMIDTLFRELGLSGVELNLNSLGCPDCRPTYRDTLTSFLQQRISALCEDCQRRYTANPLRALDCKSANCKEATVQAPSILDCLCDGCKGHFHAVKEGLTALNVPFVVNPRLVRGLDYYTRT